MKVAIVMVNDRTPGLVLDCLRSLADERAAGLDLMVRIGDAESGDGSVEAISRFIDAQGYDWARCVAIGRNGGFAYGNNFVLKHHVLVDPGVTHVHFLNPDTYVHPGAVRELARFLAAHPDAGAAGSRLENPDGSRRSCAFRFPAPWREFFRGASFSLLDRLVPASRAVITPGTRQERVDWVSGASFMMPRAVLEQVGPMDDGFFLYFEETDLMARIRDAGYEVWHVPQSRVVHLAGQATGYRAGGRPSRLSAHWLRSRARYLKRRHGRGGLVGGTVLYLPGDLGLSARLPAAVAAPVASKNLV
ncbi:glycosyltransferase [Rhodobaculum claviforme]|uniref:glycosyltransferase n=1 Tax=Rhodobaculum claviforme TaxID=1549854 RepID=UPI00191239F7|nr:glycosyltransferase family 2 protein [Rhodobaculum claviforme]